MMLCLSVLLASKDSMMMTLLLSVSSLSMEPSVLDLSVLESSMLLEKQETTTVKFRNQSMSFSNLDENDTLIDVE